MTLTDKYRLAISIYQQGATLRETAAQSSVPYNQLYKHLRFMNLLRKVRITKGSVDPDPETIAARCAEIQAGWTPEETSRRWVGRAGIRRCPARVLIPGRVA
jgi:hypothetical protein